MMQGLLLRWRFRLSSEVTFSMEKINKRNYDNQCNDIFKGIDQMFIVFKVIRNRVNCRKLRFLRIPFMNLI